MYSDPSGYQYYPYQNEVNAINKAQLERWLSMGAPGGRGGGSIFPKYGVLGSPRNNLEYEKQLAYNLDTREGGSFFTDGLNQRISTFGKVSYIETSKLRRENVQVLDYTLKNGELYLKGTKFFNIYVPSKLTALNPNNANRIAELFGKYNAQSGGGSTSGDELLIELNIKFGVGYERSYNLGGFGAKAKASATMDYMTFRLTEKGFKYIPYRKATVEGSFGHAMLNGGVKMDYNGYNSQWSGNATFANFDFSTSQAPMITPLSFGYQMPLGFGFDFKFSVNAYSAFQSFDRADQVHRQVTGVGIWYGPKY